MKAKIITPEQKLHEEISKELHRRLVEAKKRKDATSKMFPPLD